MKTRAFTLFPFTAQPTLSTQEIHTMIRQTLSLSLATFLFALTTSASATVIPLAHWRGGENDPGALAGNAANTTAEDFTDSGNDATLAGGSTYSSATGLASSSLSLAFTDSGDNFSRPVVTTAQDN